MILGLFIGCVVLLAAFLLVETRVREPLLPLRLFVNRVFSAANVGALIVGFASPGSIFFSAQFFQQVQGYTVLEAGLRTFPISMGAFLTAPFAGRLAGRIGPRLPIVLGGLLSGGALFLLIRLLLLAHRPARPLCRDDCHLLDSQPVDQALTSLVEHLPPQMHLVIVTREDPQLPLARLRVRGQLTELRATDLRFTPAEAAAFLNQVMGLTLSAEHIAALERRTEGWIAGLQLAALSMQGHEDATSFIQSFKGLHHFVLDYLVEEVLGQQPERIQMFLLCTSILDRLCGPLCDAVLLDASASGQATLAYLERANLFIVPLDNERRWLLSFTGWSRCPRRSWMPGPRCG